MSPCVGMLDHDVFVHVADVIETDPFLGMLDHDVVVHIVGAIEMDRFMECSIMTASSASQTSS